MLPSFLTGRSFNFPLYTLCAGVLAITALAAGLTYWLLDRNERNWTYEYGQALANLSAHRALDSTLNHDLVSLQVILSDVAENPSVINATIHDVENNLLVQAGRRNANPGSNHFGNFSAPITLHNSIAGYVTITLDLDGQNPFIGQLMWLFGLLAATLIAFALCYAYFSRSKILSEQQRSAIPIVKSPAVIATKTQLEETGAAPLLQHQIQVMLCLQNYVELSRQLNSKALRDVNQRLEQQMAGVLALYNGKLVHAGNNNLFIQFTSSDSENDAIFNGICATLLLFKLNQMPNAFPLQLSALLFSANPNQSILKQLSYFLAEQEDFAQVLIQAQENTLLIQGQLLEDDRLGSRFLSEPYSSADDFIRIVAVEQPYLELLEKQVQQLTDR